MKKIRIVHCLGQLNTGGAETLVMNMLRNMDSSKIQFDILLFSKEEGFYDKEAKELGVNCFYSPSMGSVGIFKYIKCMTAFFKEQNIDVVHSHMDWQGGFIAYAAYKAGIKNIIVHSHANQKMFEKNFVYKSMIEFNKILIEKYATYLCACSTQAGKTLFRNRDFQVITNGINIKKFLTPNYEVIEELKRELHIKENDILLGCIGSFTKNKNQEFLIELMRTLVKTNNNYKLILVGQGAVKRELEEKVDRYRLGESVIFAGVRTEIPEILHLLDVFLFPSITEGLGIVAVEAQASKTPCIVSETIPKEVDMGLGLVEYVSLSDKQAWVQNIERKVLEKKEVEDKDIIYSKFNIKITIEQLFKIYEEERWKN